MSGHTNPALDTSVLIPAWQREAVRALLERYAPDLVAMVLGEDR